MNRSKNAAERLEKERREVGELESKEPLRRRLLIALSKGPATSTELSKIVDARPESVSRKLTEMRKAGLLAAEQDLDDRRQSAYSLTPQGRDALGAHLAFGKGRTAPPPPGREEKERFMREALADATAMRQEENKLRDAADRFEEIRLRAEDLEAPGIALEALAELAKTQRQARRRKPLAQSLDALQEIALGETRSGDLILPAIAHLEYERGKSKAFAEENLAATARHLTAAVSLFEQLTAHSPKPRALDWRGWQAWSVLSLATNLRRQSMYEESLRHAASALRMFDELEDDYGQSHCWFLFGFNLRLLRRFDEALSCLQRAKEIAVAQGNAFTRARANCLMQMGEVRRCQGHGAEARELLNEAVDLAGGMDLVVTEAFAISAIGAMEFQEKDFERAQVTLRGAQKIFNRCGHKEGIALNARRQATVARRLSGEGIKPNDKEVKGLIKLAEDIYWQMGSPAGVAACEVERGWMRMYSPRCGKVETIVNRLNGMLGGDRRLWESLVHDTWAPRVLRDFASEAENEDLTRETKKLYTIANRELQEKGVQGVESIAAVTRAFKVGQESRPGALVIEMGGESSRKEPPEALPPRSADAAGAANRQMAANR